MANVSEVAFPSEEDLCMFVAWCKLPLKGGGGGIQGASIALYMSGIRWLFVSKGWPDPTESRPRLALLLQASKKSHTTLKPFRRPMTVELLQEAKKFLKPDTDLRHALIWMAMVFGVIGLFRLGELVPNSKGDKHHSFVSLQEITVVNEAVTVRLRASKTDVTHQGVDVVMEALPLSHALSPASAFARVLSRRTRLGIQPDLPLFTAEDGLSVTKKEVVDAMNASVSAVDTALGIPSGGKMFGHSLRRGGATSLAHAGVSDAVIQGLGRWKSSAYTLYIQMDPRLRRAAYSRLASAVPSSSSRAAEPYSMDEDDSFTSAPTLGVARLTPSQDLTMTRVADTDVGFGSSRLTPRTLGASRAAVRFWRRGHSGLHSGLHSGRPSFALARGVHSSVPSFPRWDVRTAHGAVHPLPTLPAHVSSLPLRSDTRADVSLRLALPSRARIVARSASLGRTRGLPSGLHSGSRSGLHSGLHSGIHSGPLRVPLRATADTGTADPPRPVAAQPNPLLTLVGRARQVPRIAARYTPSASASRRSLQRSLASVLPRPSAPASDHLLW